MIATFMSFDIAYFADHLYADIEDAVKEIRLLSNTSLDQPVKQRAERIENTLIGVAEKLASHGIHAKASFERLRKHPI